MSWINPAREPAPTARIWVYSLAWLLAAAFVFSGAPQAPHSPARAAMAAPQSAPPPLAAMPTLAAQPTPFQPEPQAVPTGQPVPTPTLSPPPGAAAEVISAPGLDFYGVDFSRTDIPVKMKIYPPQAVNGGKAIVIKIFPGPACAYEDHRACLSAYRAPDASAAIFATVHSGLHGEAESFRRAVEGMGLSGAAWPLKRVLANLEALAGAPVTLVQGNLTVDGFTLAAVGRVPPDQMAAYFSTGSEQALAQAAQAAPGLQPFVQPGQPQLVFETCGWQHPQEAWAPGVTPSTGSVYLGVIQKTRVK